MKQMIESFVTVFLILVSVLMLTQFIAASMQIRFARQFHSTCIGEIESSDFDEAVIKQCQTSAEENGFELVVDDIRTNRPVCANCNGDLDPDTMVCKVCGQTGGINANDRICHVNLKYQVNMMFADVHEKGVLYGFAR